MDSPKQRKFVLYRATHGSSSQARKITLIYFITGNPGLIDYYNAFLSGVCNLLSTTSCAAVSSRIISISGHDLSGFGTSAIKESNDIQSEPGTPPFSLEEQIKRVQQILISTATDPMTFGMETLADLEVTVILVGHSVGAYILLELVRSLRSKESAVKGLRIVGGICLFPTVVDIAKSPSGRRLNALCKIPAFPQIVSILAKCLTFFVSQHVLQRLVALVTRFPPNAATVSVEFLRSKYGVLQALYMGRDEMQTITLDKWDEQVWGAATSSGAEMQPARLFFYFGADDHWVANETRDELMAARAYNGDGNTWKPRMEIDKFGIPHGFPIRHSDPIAKKVASYVEEILRHVES